MPSERQIKIRKTSSKDIRESIEAIVQKYKSKRQYYIIDSLTATQQGIIKKIKPKTVTRTKDWECDIPDPDPFMKPVSNPSAQVRAKLRTKRKKQK